MKTLNDNNHEFLSMLAHELRNPLEPIRNALEIWKRGDASKEIEKEAQMIMDRQLQQVVQLVDDLLDVARIERGVIIIEEEPVDLQRVINYAVDGCRQHFAARQQEISVSMPKDVVCVKGDAVRLKQIVSNLLINAAKYTGSAGHIAVTLECEADHALIRIVDNGAGISAEFLPHIFDLLVKEGKAPDRKQGSLGIGLTLVRHLVKLQGGTVEAKSEGLKKGSEFIVRLPMLHGMTGALPAALPAALQNDTFVKRRILIIEDGADTAMSTQSLLKLQGHSVQAVFDGPSGIQAAQTFKPDIILLDIGLPGMDGYEVARHLRALPEAKKILLIALSGHGQAEDLRKSKEAGFDHHLLKPADPRELQTLIAACEPASIIK